MITDVLQVSPLDDVRIPFRATVVRQFSGSILRDMMRLMKKQRSEILIRIAEAGSFRDPDPILGENSIPASTPRYNRDADE